MLNPLAEEGTGDRQRGFRRNRSTTDRIRVFCIRQILEKNGITMRQCISYLEAAEKPIIQLGGRSCIIFS
jgi:hypothetical protein